VKAGKPCAAAWRRRSSSTLVEVSSLSLVTAARRRALIQPSRRVSQRHRRGDGENAALLEVTWHPAYLPGETMRRITSALRATVRAYTTTAEQRLATPHWATAHLPPPPSSATSAIAAASTHVPSLTYLFLGAPTVALLPPPPSDCAAFECGRGDKRTLKGKRKAQSTGTHAPGLVCVLSLSCADSYQRVCAGKCRPKSSSAKPRLPTQMDEAPHPAPPL
jgi:hypothetical protein